MPYLPTGDYSVVAAIAEGTQEENVIHHWIDDALFFRFSRWRIEDPGRQTRHGR